MSFAKKFENTFRYLLPAPLTIALLLTLLTFVLAAFFTASADGKTGLAYGLELAEMWQSGLWNTGLLAFTVQMMLILVLGHVLALTPIVNRLINTFTKNLETPAKATALVGLSSMAVAYFNWGLGLVVGAILVYKTAEKFKSTGTPFNYGLLGAAGYCSMLVWHGGFSGSAPLKVVETNHLGSLLPAQAGILPSSIPLSETLLSTMNITTTLLSLITFPVVLYFLARQSSVTLYPFNSTAAGAKANTFSNKIGAEKLDYSSAFSTIIGACILLICVLLGYQNFTAGKNVLSLNFINLCLLGLSFCLHKSVASFLNALEKAIGGVSGILIQFPLYFGIMGIMRDSGLLLSISNFFSSIASAQTLPLYTFASAGLVNILVPSGGGQWSIQGPILLESCLQTGASIPKTIMAMSYGDQLTNMLQPFWALPLLGITGLKARDIIPFSFVLFIAGLLLYFSILMLF